MRDCDTTLMKNRPLSQPKSSLPPLLEERSFPKDDYCRPMIRQKNKFTGGFMSGCLPMGI